MGRPIQLEPHELPDAITNGVFDVVLDQAAAAIERRKKAQRAEVLKQVWAVYGQSAVIHVP